MGFENHSRAISALKDHPMTQKAQKRCHRSLNQVLAVILEQVVMLPRKAMRLLIVWMKGNVRKTVPWSQLVMLFEHDSDPFKIGFGFWSDEVISGLISAFGNQPDQEARRSSDLH